MMEVVNVAVEKIVADYWESLYTENQLVVKLINKHDIWNGKEKNLLISIYH